MKPPYDQLKKWVLSLSIDTLSEGCRSISQLFGLVEDECGFLEVLKFLIERELNQGMRLTNSPVIFFLFFFVMY